MRGATPIFDEDYRAKLFQSTHPVRGATLNLPVYIDERYLISIHAPREGCDFDENYRAKLNEFQSTHPVRGATADKIITTKTQV